MWRRELALKSDGVSEKGAEDDVNELPSARDTGDRAVIRGHHVGEPEQDAEILETLGDDGAPPFLVRWEDGHTSRLYPGSDVYVQHFEHPGEPRRDGEPSRELSELR